ncbi:F1F0 ATP synthase subunit d SCDLUD_003078 [Saccharomycodes ludwigii]|uniref:F1F0 ATP synthase subunit d n=1 Tax=Saccharomycodes ludwigii TaxID=36035 RepID=UPI001E87222D|nr:hypothetical protein SCDLUD_003078 [Saccharomycodes ludwigii]KAH3900111.1 hypothetical protein SCDLUD_003078 [Saccharomycodes ludwigii]
MSSLAKSAANKIEWAKVISSLKLTGKTATELASFRKRNEEARRKLFELKQQPTDVDFSHYRSVLKNGDVVSKIESYFNSYKPVTIETAGQISVIEAFQSKAIENAQETEKVVAKELKDLQETLRNIESARPFDELTVDELAKSKPEIEAKVEEMVKKGKWEVPGYASKFGDLNAM